MLILAGVSISMLSGDNSILSQAGRARDITGEKSIAERVQLAYLAALTNGKGNIERANLLSELQKEFGADKIQDGDIDSGLTKVTIDEKDYNFDGTVAPGDGEGGGGNSGLVEQADGTFKDSNNNEWVFIEVPKTVTQSATTDSEIYSALRTYVAEDDFIITGTSSDSYTTTTAGYTDTWYDGCGLSESEYNTTKSAMLNSIKDNGGFYIGKYETGIDDTSIAENATTTTGLRISSGNTTQTAVIKQNKQPYTYVTCSQAQNLAQGFATDGKQASLLFGIQWDLVLKFIKVKESLSDNTLLTSNSTTWGNYYNNTYNITNTNAWYSTDYGASWTKGAYNKTLGGGVLLSTGANTDFSKQNIYDLAGNVDEWTLEKASYSSDPCASRGGFYGNGGGSNPASFRNIYNPTESYHAIGFRVALY